MRTGIVALAYLDDPAALAEAARAVSELTHHDDIAGDACVLWCSGIRTAVLEGTFDGVRAGLDYLPDDRAAQWRRWLDEAEKHPPHHFSPNGFVVPALQAAWSAITRTPQPSSPPHQACQHLQDALANAVRAGHDTDTVAAIAGALLGARWGASAIPLDWQRLVHGWPGHRASDLVRLAVLTAKNGTADGGGWPTAARQAPIAAVRPLVTEHPCDDGVLLGNLHLARLAPESLDVDAVVSLCRIGQEDFAHLPATDRLQVWLVDSLGANANAHFVVDQAARAVATLRSEGKRVLLHCAAGRSRTIIVAARYATLLTGAPPRQALATVLKATGTSPAHVNPELRTVLEDLPG